MESNSEIKFQVGDRFTMKDAKPGILYAVKEVTATGYVITTNCGTVRGNPGTFTHASLRQQIDEASYVKSTMVRPSKLRKGDVFVANAPGLGLLNAKMKVVSDSTEFITVVIISEEHCGKHLSADPESYWIATMLSYEPGPDTIAVAQEEDRVLNEAMRAKAWRTDPITLTRGYVRDLVKAYKRADTSDLLVYARYLESYLHQVSVNMGLPDVKLQDIPPVGPLGEGFVSMAHHLSEFFLKRMAAPKSFLTIGVTMNHLGLLYQASLKADDQAWSNRLQELAEPPQPEGLRFDIQLED